MKKIILLFLLITQPTFAEYINNDIVAGCDSSTLHDVNYITNMFPIFTAHKHTCNPNEFLPANIDGCRTCPIGYTCNGGTYTFNETIAQGINKKILLTESITHGCSNNLLNSTNNITNMLPAWTPNQHACAPGYYLPANNDSCIQCPENNYCIGGTYTFNETTDQGITHCPEKYQISPTGSSSEKQCHNPIINLNWFNGENIVAQTTCEYGNTIQLPPEPTKNGYIFIGWQLKQ